MDPERILVLAKKHLRLTPSAPITSVPKSYLEELKTHLLIYPHDNNFLITAEPKAGYGKLICLENGCNSIAIPLEHNLKLKDGGKSEGIGALSTYRYHIVNHATHQKQRHARVKAESMRIDAKATPPQASTSKAVVKKEPINVLRLLDSTPPTTPGSRVSTPSSSFESKPLVRLPARSSLVRLSSTKAEPVEPTIPRKRFSDSGLDAVHQSSPAGVSPPKRTKVEAPKAKPLALVDSNSYDDILAQSNAEELRLKIATVQSTISSYQGLANKVTSKKKKTKADLTRLRRYEMELDRLRAEKARYTASLPSMSPRRAQAAPKTEYTSMAVPPPFNPFGRTQATPAQVGRVPPAYNHPAFGTQPKTEHKTERVPPAYNYAAFGVKPKAEAPPAAFDFPSVAKAPAQPVASGSNNPAPLNPLNQGWDEDMTPEEAAAAAAVLQRIGGAIPYIAPLPGAENFDDAGNFHGRGRDNFQGPVAKADDIEKFLRHAGNSEQFDGNASVDKALEKLGLENIYQLLPDLTVPLMAHQAIGVAWMLEKEKGPLKGGCLGDDMGLGKTVQTIALIAQNRSKNPACKTTLIIAPTALLDQWKLEIELKTDEALKCLIYHGSSKPRSKKELLRFDVVLTTFGTVAMEWPDIEGEEKKKKKQKAAKKKASDAFIVSDDSDSDVKPKRNKKKEKGLLFQVEFYRIVLDEAQNIRNKRTRVSRAATFLDSTYRWCLTGTPIINGITDVYPYLRFLKIRPWYDFDEFNSYIGRLEKKQPALAVSRLQSILSTFLLRRMKDTELDGKRLIELPNKTVELVKLEFTEEERDVYTMVEASTQATFNRYLRAGTVLKNYTQVLVLLLRLRQICSHPSLIQEDAQAFISQEEFEEQSNEELTRALRLMGPDFVSKLKRKLKETALQRMEAEKQSADATTEDSEECPVCFDAFTTPRYTACQHLFCETCIEAVLNAPAPEAAEDGQPKLKANERPCPSCRAPISLAKTFERKAFEPTDEELNGTAEDADVEMLDAEAIIAKRTKKNPKKKAPKKKRESDDVINVDTDTEMESEEDDEDDDISDFIVESDEDEEEKDARRDLKKKLGKRKAFVVVDSDDEIEDLPEEKEVLFGKKKKAKMTPEQIKLLPRFLPSTKMKWMMEHIRDLAEKRPDEKILVISQWTSCLSLVSDYLTESGILHVKYQGGMNRVKREAAVKVFMAKQQARVLLLSLKAGGVGLNLTRANNVISLDLGWSQAIESQAYDRVHRLGQTREVDVRRLVISNTVEDRVLQMQERKQSLADGSLGEGQGKKIGKLTVRELANLFGLDHRGRVLDD